MTHSTELRTERLLLRPFRLGDVDDVFAYAADPKWGAYLFAVPQPYTRRDAEEFVSRSVLTSRETGAVFAIVLTDKVIGGINLRLETGHRRAELGYSLAREYWGRGLTPEAAQVVVDWAFQTHDLEKVYARCHVSNTQSWRVMEKLGMVREGLLRSHEDWRGIRRDIFIFGLLRTEWEARRTPPSQP